MEREPYIYERLGEPSSSIRLVTLSRGAPEDTIQIQIRQFSLQYLRNVKKDHALEILWQALSYTWGDLGDTQDILVESSVDHTTSQHLRCLSVTKNLADALRHLRLEDEDRLLWADAICIDQGSDESALHERAQQVRIMHHIYSQADGVIIWLGLGYDDSSYALQLLKELASPITVDWTTYAISTTDGKTTSAMEAWTNRRRSDSQEYKAIVSLLGRSWFERV